ncbi:hypothetical protein GQ53DRAFT_708009 [Thozetella sp. PMI_491]|nr:hypothetical protein GQ53DRAFT_708009 [Thozetella sp. PMI_491]
MEGGPDTSIVRPACLVCRSRKVKCDRTSPACRCCQKLGIRCPGYSRAGDLPEKAVKRIYSDSQVEKRRVGSCRECRRMKLKCDQAHPQCRRCQERGLDCVYAPPPAASYSWLFEKSLPQDPDKVSSLVSAYFDHLHPRRCLGFIHKPSFMRSMDQGTLMEEYGEPLVLIVCALGAYLQAANFTNSAVVPHATTTVPGEAWATTARKAVLMDLSTASLKSAMVLVLLSEYAVMTRQNAWAFLLVGSAFRVIRLLRLDNAQGGEAPQNPLDATELESSRRVVWACFLLDSQIGSGVDKNLNWRDDDAPPIPLPCTEEAFTYGSLPDSSGEATIVSFPTLPPHRRVNLRANIIYVMWLRSQALRLNRVSELKIPLWDGKSPFLELLHKFESWYEALPEQLQLNDLNIYAQIEQNTISAIYVLHFAYHSAVADLTRVSLPGFDFPLAALFRDAPPAFQQQCQERCRHHADEVSRLVELGLAEGGRALDDPHCLSSAFEAAKIQAVHTATLTRNGPEERARAFGQIAANLTILHKYRRNANPRARDFVSGLLLLLTRFGFKDAIPPVLLEAQSSEMEQEAEVVGPADSNHLSQVANFRQALSEVAAQRRDKASPRPSQTSGRPQPAPQPAISPINTVAATDGTQDTPGAVLGGEMATEGATVSEDIDYFRVADEMSNYMTWDFLELPPWVDFDHPAG